MCKEYKKFYDKVLSLYIVFSDDFIESDKCTKLIMDIQKELLKIHYISEIDF